MSLLLPSELLEIQSLANSGMASTATILTRAVIETADGQENVWATVGEDVSCWVKQITGDSQTLGNIAGAVGIAQLVNIRFAVGTPVSSGDRIAIGSTIYDAQAANTDDTFGVWLEMACRTID